MKNRFLLFVLVFTTLTVDLNSQTNDNFINALFLNISENCEPDTLSSLGATAEPDLPNPGCGFFKGGDVWFKFVMPNTAAVRIEVKPVQGGGMNPQYAIYGGTRSNLVQYACKQLDATFTFYNENLITDTVFLRVYNYNSALGGEFSLCVKEVSVPVNNFFNDALAIDVGLECNADTFTNEYAVADTNAFIPPPTCGFYRGGDVWFQSVMPESGALRIEAKGLTTNPQTVIYGQKMGELSQIICNQLNPEKTIFKPEYAGDTIFVRVFSYNSDEGGEFSLCLFEPSIVGNNFFSEAIHLDVKPEYIPDTFTNKYATSDTSSFIPTPSCGFYSGGDVWFTSVIPANGAFRIETNNISMNPQNAIYFKHGDDFVQLVCNQLDNAQTIHRPDLAGDSIFIEVWNYNSEEGGEFAIGLWQPEIPVNDSCMNAIMLEVKTACKPDTFTNAYATSFDLPSPSPGCGFYSGGDVWFQFVIPDSGRVLIERNNINNVNAQFAVYSGLSGNLNLISCAQLKSSLLIDEPGMAGDTLKLRVFNYNSEEGGEFSLCLTDPDCSILNIETNLIGSRIYVLQDDAEYQWINCADSSILAGDTLQWLDIPEAGSYAVIVTQGSCVDTSACVDALTVGLSVPEFSEGIVYPNPAQSYIQLKNFAKQTCNYHIYTIQGVLVSQGKISSDRINIGHLHEGNYILRVTEPLKTTVYRFSKTE